MSFPLIPDFVTCAPYIRYSEQVKIVPARYEWTEQRVLVSEAGSELRAIPATFGTVSETYEVSPASTRWVMDSKSGNVVANAGMLAMALLVFEVRNCRELRVLEFLEFLEQRSGRGKELFAILVGDGFSLRQFDRA